jgi:capsular polysaccharide biosynthesis protein
VVLTENIKVLVFAPIAVGVCALGVSFLAPQKFTSTALLRAEQQSATLVTSAAVLDPVIEKLGLNSRGSIEKSRAELHDRIKTTASAKDKIVTLDVSSTSPSQARDISNAILQQLFAQSRPRNSERDQLEILLKAAKLRAQKASEAASIVLNKLEIKSATPASLSEPARGYAELLNVVASAEIQISALETQLNGLNPSHVLQHPTLPEMASHPKKLFVSLMSSLICLLLLMGFFCFKAAHSIQNANNLSTQKWKRVREALGFRA